MSRSSARVSLIGLVSLLAWGLLPVSKAPPRRLPPAGAGDVKLHVNVVQRIGAGEPYYSVFGDELRRGTYPAKSIFNWRTPAHYVLVALLTAPIATALLKLLTLASVLLTAWTLHRFNRLTLLVGTVSMMGAVATAFQPDAVAVAEVWAGVLIALSLGAYYSRYAAAAALLALGALFFRELAAPYCVVCALLALRRRRRLEIAIWSAGLIAYATYFGWHTMQVVAHRVPEDLAHEESWLRWNGVRFILATIGVNGWLGFLPARAAALYMTGALAGTLSRSSIGQLKWSVVLYFLFFMIAGQPFNYYWGFVTAPLWAFAFAHAIEGSRTLIASAFPRPAAVGVSH